jgi:8-oxo-dGTP diphosphatase
MIIKKLSSEELRQHKGISFTGISTAFICHDGNGKLFLAKRSKNTRDEHGRWDSGGGGLKHGQAIEDNLRREIKEEYGADALKVEFLGYVDAFRQTLDGQPTHWLTLYFAVLVNPKQVRIGEPDMVEESGWYDLDELPEPMHSQYPKFMELHGEKLRKAMQPK